MAAVVVTELPGGRMSGLMRESGKIPYFDDLLAASLLQSLVASTPMGSMNELQFNETMVRRAYALADTFCRTHESRRNKEED